MLISASNANTVFPPIVAEAGIGERYALLSILTKALSKSIPEYTTD